MRLTKFTDNALRVLIYAAVNSDRLTNISEIANKCAIPRNHLTKVVHTMATHGLLVTVRGKGGGIRLARPASEINVADVVRTMEDDLKIIECFEPPCPILEVCTLKNIMGEARHNFLATLQKFTIADLVNNRTQLVAAGWG